MTLLASFRKSGDFFFRYRGQLPLILFVLAVPVIYLTEYQFIPDWIKTTLLVCSLTFTSIGFFIRIYAIGTTPGGTSGRNTKRQIAEELNTSGLYSIVRHPLYLGNFLIWFGLALFTYNIYFVILVGLGFWLIYERIMVTEERFLKRNFGEAFFRWSKQVPAIFPRFKGYRKSDLSFSWKTVLRREYSGFLAIVFSFAFVDHLRWYFINGTVELLRPSSWFLLMAMIITLILRTLKYRSHILEEEGRT